VRGEAIFTEDIDGFITVEFDPPEADEFYCTKQFIEQFVYLHNNDNIIKNRQRKKSEAWKAWVDKE
jgi:hypothetical protein